jgi:hypothetical protein
MQVPHVKQRILEELWLPRAIALGNNCYPRLKKNKKMRILTLTDESSCLEIEAFKRHNLTTNENIFGWTGSFSKRARLETFVPIKLVGSGRFEDCISADDETFASLFPFDVLNIDFASQNSEGYVGRIEREVAALELVLKMEKERTPDNKKFVLFFTTKLNSHPVNFLNIKMVSDSIRVTGWLGIDMQSLPENATTDEERIAVVDRAIQQLRQKYKLDATVESRIYEMQTSQKTYSTAETLRGV